MLVEYDRVIQVYMFCAGILSLCGEPLHVELKRLGFNIVSDEIAKILKESDVKLTLSAEGIYENILALATPVVEYV